MTIKTHRHMSGSWEAVIVGNPCIWEAGRSEAEAIGKIVITVASGNIGDLDIQIERINSPFEATNAT